MRKYIMLMMYCVSIANHGLFATSRALNLYWILRDWSFGDCSVKVSLRRWTNRFYPSTLKESSYWKKESVNFVTVILLAYSTWLHEPVDFEIMCERLRPLGSTFKSNYRRLWTSDFISLVLTIFRLLFHRPPQSIFLFYMYLLDKIQLCHIINLLLYHTFFLR